jgi:hypothetical protein
MSNSITIWWHITPSARSWALGASHRTANLECMADTIERMLTYDWFSTIVDFKGTKTIPNEERKVEYIFHWLCEVVGVDYKAEKVHGARFFKDFFDLRWPLYAMHQRGSLKLTLITFFVVSFSERWISSSFISCGLLSSSLLFSSLARFTGARFFCSTERGPSLQGAECEHMT